MTSDTAMGNTVEVNPSEFKREWHNYNRLILGIAATCLFSVVGVFFVNAQWQAKTDEKLVGYNDRFRMVDERDAVQDRQIETLNTYQSQINGRLGVIEERTSNTVDGIKRIENKLDKK